MEQIAERVEALMDDPKERAPRVKQGITIVESSLLQIQDIVKKDRSKSKDVGEL